jgi:hypothetical protein
VNLSSLSHSNVSEHASKRAACGCDMAVVAIRLSLTTRRGGCDMVDIRCPHVLVVAGARAAHVLVATAGAEEPHGVLATVPITFFSRTCCFNATCGARHYPVFGAMRAANSLFSFLACGVVCDCMRFGCPSSQAVGPQSEDGTCVPFFCDGTRIRSPYSAPLLRLRCRRTPPQQAILNRQHLCTALTDSTLAHANMHTLLGMHTLGARALLGAHSSLGLWIGAMRRAGGGGLGGCCSPPKSLSERYSNPSNPRLQIR